MKRNEIADKYRKKAEEKLVNIEEFNTFFKESENIIYHFIDKYGISVDKWDDVYSFGAEAIYKAYLTWEDGKGMTLNSYTFECIKNAVFYYFRRGKQKGFEKDVKLTLDQPIPEAKNAGTYLEFVEDDCNVEEEVIDSIKGDKFDDILKYFSPKTQQIMTMYFKDNISQPKIGKMFGMTQASVSKHIVDTLEKIKELLNIEEADTYKDCLQKIDDFNWATAIDRLERQRCSKVRVRKYYKKYKEAQKAS